MAGQLASAADLAGTPFTQLWDGADSAVVDAALARASRSIESMCDRRLLPFTGLVEEVRMSTVDGDAVGAGAAAIGGTEITSSYASQLGVATQPRSAWLAQYPPRYEDTWTGALTGLAIRQSYGGPKATLDPSTAEFDASKGYLRVTIGTYVEPGSTLYAIYSGGYSTVPEDLAEACLFVAARRRLLQTHLVDDSSASGQDLKDVIDELLSPYKRP